MTAPLSKQHLTYLRSKLDDGLSSIDSKLALRLLDELQQSDEAFHAICMLLKRYEASGASPDAKGLAQKILGAVECTSSYRRNQAAQKPQKASTWGT